MKLSNYAKLFVLFNFVINTGDLKLAVAKIDIA